MKKLKRYIPAGFVIFATILLIAIFAVENINHRFWLNDFKVYYGAVQAFLDGTPVYGTLYSLGSGYYKYSPFTLLLVLPVCLLPYSIASIIQFILLSASIIALFIVVWHMVANKLYVGEIKRTNFFLSVAFLCVINHLVRELHLGNINVVLLLLLCLSLLFIIQSKPVWAGILLAVVIITKPFFMLLLMPLLLRRNDKVLFSFGAAMLFFVLCPALFTGFSKNIELHQAWIQTLLEHNTAFPSNNTMENLVRLYIHSNLPSAFQFYIMIAVCLAYLVFFLVNQSAQRKMNDNQELKTANLMIEWFTLIAIMPSLFKTDTQHFLLTLPLLMVLFYYVWKEKSYIVTTAFVVLVFMYGGNSSDLVGKICSSRIEEAGLLGISNLVILSWVIILHFKFIKKGFQVSR